MWNINHIILTVYSVIYISKPISQRKKLRSWQVNHRQSCHLCLSLSNATLDPALCTPLCRLDSPLNTAATSPCSQAVSFIGTSCYSRRKWNPREQKLSRSEIFWWRDRKVLCPAQKEHWTCLASQLTTRIFRISSQRCNPGLGLNTCGPRSTLVQHLWVTLV